MMKLIGRWIPLSLKRKINGVFQDLTGYSAIIQKQQRDIAELADRAAAAERELELARAILAQVKAVSDNLQSRLNQAESRLGIPMAAAPALNIDAVPAAVLLDGAMVDTADLTFIKHAALQHFSGGVYNQGMCDFENGYLAVARAERHSEIERAQEPVKMMQTAVPLLLNCDMNGHVRDYKQLKMQGYPARRFRAEDFRMFRFQGRIYVNHPFVKFPLFYNFGSVRDYSVEQVLAQLDLQDNKLVYIGKPALDRKVSRIEKNWVYLEKGGDLYLFYMFYPHYVVKKLTNFEKLEFLTIIDRKLKIPGMRSIPFISYSTNPVDYDESHYLVVVHARRSAQVLDYLHWGVLIDKKSLMPAYMTRIPLIRGGKARGIYKHVVFISGVVRSGDQFVFAAGEGDYHASSFSVKKSYFEDNWISINQLSSETEISSLS